jgi:hypothetical protein
MGILITVGAQQFAAGTTALTGRGLSLKTLGRVKNIGTGQWDGSGLVSCYLPAVVLPALNGGPSSQI